MEPLESQHLGDGLKKKKPQRNLKTTLGTTKMMEGGLARAAYRGRLVKGCLLQAQGYMKIIPSHKFGILSRNFFTSVLVPPGDLAQPFTIVQVRQEKPPGRKEPGGAESSQSYSQ